MVSVRVAQVLRRSSTWRGALIGGVTVLVACIVMGLTPGHAFAQTPAVTIPSGPFTNGQTIAVTGSDFPPQSQLPTGLSIIECSDPDGSTDNLPTDPVADCDATTVNGSQINTDSNGNFSTTYSVFQLSQADGSAINCDATDFCVLWVGQDYNNAFLSGPHAFSDPFEMTGGTTSTTTTSTTSPTTTTSTTSPTTTTSTTSPTTTTSTTSPTTTTRPRHPPRRRRPRRLKARRPPPRARSPLLPGRRRRVQSRRQVAVAVQTVRTR